MDNPQEDRQRIASTGERPVRPENSMEQLVSPKDERIVSANPSPDAATIGPLRDVTEHSRSSKEGGDLNDFTHEQNMLYGGYGNTTGSWDGYSQFFNNEGIHIPSVIYSENPSALFSSGYGFPPEMAYGQFSPVGTPLPPVMVEGQLYSPQQIPFSPTYYPQPAPSNVPSAVPISPSELMTPESNNDNFLFGPGPGYLVQLGSFGGGSIPGNPSSSSVTSPAAYPQAMGILGSYEHNVGQRPLHGFGSSSSSSVGHYPYGGSYPRSNFSSSSFPYLGANDQAKFIFDKGRRHERDQDLIYISNDSHGIDRNRGPRALKLKAKSTSEQSFPSVNRRNDTTKSGLKHNLYNCSDFITDYENAKFFIIKSFSEDNVHKSIKYNVWASTPHGNKKLDAAYREEKEMKGTCPVFLLFSVNASGQFCGVAEMIGPVDFEKDAEHWQQDRWSGQFPVQWHIIKDVPNNKFRHILLENNDNKPVTHSRDTQEVRLEQGVEMLKIFKDHDLRTSILDDFDFYDDCERALKERKARQQAHSTTHVISDDSINQMANNLAQTLRLHEDTVENQSSEVSGSSRTEDLRPLACEPTNQTPDMGSETRTEPVE
ncbi:hypothetical protein SLA2020_035430 [Shorea laevis]